MSLFSLKKEEEVYIWFSCKFHVRLYLHFICFNISCFSINTQVCICTYL